MSKAEMILLNWLRSYVPRETLEQLWNTYPHHLWEGLRDKHILTRDENGMVYINVPRET